MDDLDAPNIANLAWTYDKAGKLDDNLVSSLARAAVKRVNEFTATDITNVAWTFANAARWTTNYLAPWRKRWNELWTISVKKI